MNHPLTTHHYPMFFRNRKRLIWQYYDGRRTRWADPLLIWSRLAIDEDWPEMVAQAEAGQEPGLSQVRRRLTEAFEAEPFDPQTGRGLTTWDLLDLFTQYMAYLEGLKKKRDSGPMPLLISVLRSSGDSPAGKSGGTSSGPDSTSTPSGSSEGEAGR